MAGPTSAAAMAPPTTVTADIPRIVVRFTRTCLS
jgi:hypothetical protein